MMHRPILFLPLLLAAACDSPPLSTAVDVGVYAGPTAHLRVGYEYWNRGRTDVFLSSCDHVVLVVAERQVNGAWRDVGSAACPDGTGPMAPLRLAPGGSGRSEVAVPERGVYRVGVLVVQPETGEVYRRIVSESVTVR